MKTNGVWLICSAVVAVGVLSSCGSSGAALPSALAAAGCSEDSGRISCPSGADLIDADLPQVDLGGANLNGANLAGANLYDANLSGADLQDANLQYVSLSGANLSGANLSGANLYGIVDRERATFKTTTCPGGTVTDTGCYWLE